MTANRSTSSAMRRSHPPDDVRRRVMFSLPGCLEGAIGLQRLAAYVGLCRAEHSASTGMILDHDKEGMPLIVNWGKPPGSSRTRPIRIESI
jgi:hypothetical protein